MPRKMKQRPSDPWHAPVEFKPGILGKSTGQGITTGDLGVVDGPPAGTLDDSTGGLGQSMWSNAPRGEVEDLLGRVPLVSSDPFIHALARRLVLTVSDAPVGSAKRALVTIRSSRTLRVAASHRPRTVDLLGSAILSIETHGDRGEMRGQRSEIRGQEKMQMPMLKI